MRERVERAIDEVRVSIQGEGGDVELMEVSDRTVKVQLFGDCAPNYLTTFRARIIEALKQRVPEIWSVLVVEAPSDAGILGHH